MPRKSTIDRLPAEVRELIGELRARHGCKIDDILAKLRELKVEVSRSALARHTKQLDAIGAEMHRARAVAEALAARFGDKADDKVARTNIEMMHALLMKLMVSDDGTTVALDAKDAMFLATAFQKLSAAAKTDVERLVKVREQVAKEIAEKAAAAVDAVAGEKGLSRETVEALRARVLGVKADGKP